MVYVVPTEVQQVMQQKVCTVLYLAQQLVMLTPVIASQCNGCLVSAKVQNPLVTK